MKLLSFTFHKEILYTILTVINSLYVCAKENVDCNMSEINLKQSFDLHEKSCFTEYNINAAVWGHSFPKKKKTTNFEKDTVFLQQTDLLIFLNSMTFTMAPSEW